MQTGVFVGLIISILLAAVGLYRLRQYYNFYRHSHSRSAWSETAGTVIDVFTGYTPGMRGSRNYYAVIQYQYLVQGMKYMGEIKKHTLGGKNAATGLIEKHPHESTIQIHYNPAKPAQHVSALDKSGSYLAWSLVALIFGFLGILTAFTAR